jgi:hypothetical protein
MRSTIQRFWKKNHLEKSSKRLVFFDLEARKKQSKNFYAF